ncbi:hypothetical protein APHAL10511_007105 [Amanita phalloides]|nr:hypothetical protein APHAL10511_007105 [Amanita phalloides]
MADWTTDANDGLHLAFGPSAFVWAPCADPAQLRRRSPHASPTPPSLIQYSETTKKSTVTATSKSAYVLLLLFIPLPQPPKLSFAAGSLLQCLSITYSDKLQAATVDDVEASLAKFIPHGYHTDEATFLRQAELDARSFRPYGDLVYSYTRSQVSFEVYHSTWDTPGFREYHRRLQLFVLLFIEGGSYINDDEDAWEFMVLYEKRDSTYCLVGYSSLYNFYHFPEKVRMRLSQFIILPQYQRHGHGSELYKAIYQYVCSQPHIAELTVEDPAEAFEDLRDKNDLQMLLSNEQFMQQGFGQHALSHGGGRVGRTGKAKKREMIAKLGPPTDKAWAEKWRRELKFAARQFQRLVEMLILSRLDSLDTQIAKAYRLQVKERLYRFNYEILAQMDKQERLEKLEETFQSVKDDYQRILKMALCI